MMDFQKAQNFWTEKDKASARMDQEALKARIEAFLKSHNTLALATGEGTYVRCTPVEYTYDNGALVIMSEGGRKFIGLEKNPNVSAAVFDPYTGFGSIHGLQIQGKAEFPEPFSEEYNAFLKLKNIPVDAIKKLPEPMPMIRILPEEYDYLDSDLKKEGYSSRQHLSCRQGEKE